MKILSPAGNFENLKAAIYNGCDEVYLGINKFNARNNIDGFSLDNLKEAVDFAHTYNVKVHLAINILFNNDEIQEAFDTLIEAYNMGVDAFIIQDLALANLVHNNYPEIELHASTQMGLHNLEGVNYVKQFGFKRIVLARETPLSEIKRIKENTNLEIEYFAQGALCVSFSGNCYLSSYLHNASGNRGKCKQLCRLPYTFMYKDKAIKKGYLLSAKDFNTINMLDDLKNAKVDAIKIEGRARRAFYVGMATREYYNAIHGKKVNNDNLKLAFNRDYTEGYFKGNGNIISKYNNHIGIEIGKVTRINNGKKFNEVFFNSNRKLNKKSTFKFFNNGYEENTITAYDLQFLGGNRYKLTTTQKVDENCSVNLIMDNDLEEKVLSYKKYQPIEIDLYVFENKPIKAVFNVNGKSIEVEGDVLQSALNRPLTEIDFKDCFNKNEYFDVKLNYKGFDNVFMPKSQLNEFRRTVFERLLKEISISSIRNLPKIKVEIPNDINKFDNFSYVENIEDKFINKNIIYSPEVYDLNDIQNFIKKCESQNKVPYLDTPNFALSKDIEHLKGIIDKTNISIVANNYYALTFNTNIVIGGGLNVYNNLTSKIYNKPIIVAEGNVSSKIKFPYMTLRHCPLKAHLNANCANCPYKDGYEYKMENGKVLKLKRKKLSSCTFYLTD